MRLIRYLLEGRWEYGTCTTDFARSKARRHRLTGEVQFVLWRRGQRQGEHLYTADYWHAYDRSWWKNFRPDQGDANQNKHGKVMTNFISRFLFAVFWLPSALCALASSLPTNSVNGRVVLSWSYPTNLITDDLRFNLYQTTNLNTPWLFLTNIPATNFFPYQAAFDGTNWMATNLCAQFDIQPANYFFVASATNFWGETSVTSNIVSTPPPPQPINDSLRIRKK